MKKQIYLDNAASSHPKPKTVAGAMARAVTHAAGNPGRSFHQPSLAASRIIHEARETLAALLGLPHPERLIFTRGATEGLNLALRGLIKPGDRVAISRLEHNSVIRPLESLKQTGVEALYAPSLKNGTPDPARIPEVDMLVTVAASNVTGAIADMDALASACQAKGVKLVVDAAQAAGSIPMPWADKVSAIAMAGHKGLLGPQGIGLAWFAPGVEPVPLIEGGTGSASESALTPPFWPDRHEAGTPNTPGAAGLLAAAKYLARRGIASIQEHEVALCSIIMEALGNNPLITLYPPLDPHERASLVTFNVKGMDPARVSGLLNHAGIAVRSGLHCAPEAHRFLGSFPAGGVRVSPGPFSSKMEVRGFLDVLFKKIRER